MIRLLCRLSNCTRGAGAAEFALVLPLLLILLFGTIDAGRFLYEVNRAEKATQVGARTAIVTNPVSQGLIDEDYAGKNIGGTTLKNGDLIPAAALGTMVCTSTSCNCDIANGGTPPCPASTTVNSAAFNNIVSRMQLIFPDVTAADVQVSYSGSGFGFAATASGGADTMEVSPLVTVSLRNMIFQPLTCLVFFCQLGIPDAATTLSSEDASGTFSN